MTITKGKFCWVDLTTTNIEASKKFYGDLFQWTFTEEKAPQGGAYWMANVDGKGVAGLMGQTPTQKGVTPTWNTYFTVDSLAEFATKAEKLGAKTIVPRQPVGDFGALAVHQDPTGAYFCTWENTKSGDMTDKTFTSKTPGFFAWTELVTADIDRAGKFYSEAFGYSPEAITFGEGSPKYYIFKSNGEPQAGLMAMPSDAGKMPPHWANYVSVANCDRTLERATQLGAKTLFGPQDIPTIGRIATIQDPQGAVISFIAG